MPYRITKWRFLIERGFSITTVSVTVTVLMAYLLSLMLWSPVLARWLGPPVTWWRPFVHNYHIASAFSDQAFLLRDRCTLVVGHHMLSHSAFFANFPPLIGLTFPVFSPIVLSWLDRPRSTHLLPDGLDIFFLIWCTSLHLHSVAAKAWVFEW